jgi:formylglycine-generating enzyme required for sulfatase activity
MGRALALRIVPLCSALAIWPPAGLRAQETIPVLEIADSAAASAAEMKPYAEKIEHTDAKIEMLPIPCGKFLMGSPESEKGRKADEGPQHEVEISPFWMSKCEIPWDAYDVWASDLDIRRREVLALPASPRDKFADLLTISQPTKPYTDMTFGMGKLGYPAICMTQHAARRYCEWLSAKTGRYYRLPTEAEWEYACRAGTTTEFHFGDDLYCDQALFNFSWHESPPQKCHPFPLPPLPVGSFAPNGAGLYDMHGNVWEIVLDSFSFYTQSPKVDPYVSGGSQRVFRGGSTTTPSQWVRSACRGSQSPNYFSSDTGFRVALAPILGP